MHSCSVVGCTEQYGAMDNCISAFVSLKPQGIFNMVRVCSKLGAKTMGPALLLAARIDA